MNKDLRWRIISLQAVLIVLFAFGGGLALYAGNFTHEQITNQLAPQQISFPTDTKSGLPADLQQYAGQQVLNGEQAHAYADGFIAVHLNTIGQGKPYSYWSGLANKEKDATAKAKLDGTANTLFKGETLRSMLNQAWAFSTIGDIANYAAMGLALAALLVSGTLVFELFVAPSRARQGVRAATVAAGA
ncbi:MAG: hypothetical protein M3014_00955 [Chloroflexota bacterium]|nr:hypothetical protein [Chloroflexota bacterium]